MEYNQSFLAPSIPKPKLSKSNISSSVLRSSAVAKEALSTRKPQLKTSSFNFSRKRETEQNVIKTSQLSVDAELISSFLVETNRILVEIQKQLSLDFANRIAEQKNLLKTAKVQREKQSRTRKEFSLEKFGGVAKKITGLFAPITRPVKSIFDKLKEFLGIIVTGVILNKAFDWLSKQENREKLSNIFKFLIKNWKLLAGLFIGAKVIGGLIKVVSFIRRIKKALGFLGKGLGRGRRGGNRSRSRGDVRVGGISSGSNAGLNYGRNVDPKTGRPLRSSGSISRYNASMARDLQGRANLGDKARLKLRDVKSKLNNLWEGKPPIPITKGLSKFLRPIFKRIPIFGALIDFAVSIALGESVGRAAAKSVGAGLGAALGTLIPIPGVGTILGGVVGDLLGGSVYDMLVKPEEQLQKMAKGGMIGGKPHSQGGTKIEAERGEYIIDKFNTQRYLPVLTSIKYQGGSSWDAFTNAVQLQESLISQQFSSENKFAESLNSLKEFYDEKERKLRLEDPEKAPPSGGGSNNFYRSTPPIHEPKKRKTPKITTIPMPTRNLEKTSKYGKHGGMNFVELPPVVMNGGSNVPEIPTFKAKEESLSLPEISSFDYSNDYLNTSVSYYNIEGINFGGE